jgi:hypothetical protein
MKKKKLYKDFEDILSVHEEIKRQIDDDMLVYGICGWKEDDNGNITRINPMEIPVLIPHDKQN